MQKRPSVSIVVPTYNVEKYLKTCIESLQKQQLQDIEIILVDDGSTDESGKICDLYSQEDERIKVIHQTNRGLGLSRNSGIEVAQGEYIGFVDSDDFVSPRMFRVLYENAIQADADISYCTYKKFSDESKVEEEDRTEDIKKWVGQEAIRQYMFDRVGLPPSSKNDNLYGASVCCGIFKRDIFDKNKFISERQFIAEDMIFDIDIIPKCHCIVHYDIPMYYYRYNMASLTTVYKADRFMKNVQLYHEMSRRLEANYKSEEYQVPLGRYLLTTARIAIIQEARFVKKNGKREAKNNILSICKTEEVKNVLFRYEYWKLPMKYRITCFLIKYKKAGLLLALYKMKF